MPVTLIGLPPSSYMRTAMMVLAAKGVGYTVEMADFRADAFTALHPFRKVPVFQHGKVQLFETLAITTYIDEAFDGPALQPDNAADKATMLQWISATNDYFTTSFLRNCVRERFVKPMRGLEPDEALIAANKPTIDAHLGILNTALETTPYLAGDQMSLADYFLAPIIFYLAFTPEGRDLLPNHPAVQQWNTRMQAAPNYAQINSVG